MIEVLFEIPTAIQSGLANGTLERIGGVIRDTNNKQIVAWLREGGKISSNPNISQGLMGTLLQYGGKSSTAILGSTASVLNVAMAGYYSYKIIEQLLSLHQELEKIHERIAQEFSRDRLVQLETALEMARDAMEADNETYADNAISHLLEARNHLLYDFKAHRTNANTADQLRQAQYDLIQAMLVDTMRIRCYLMTDERFALTRLKECIDDFALLVKDFIPQWLGDHPALYFHQDVTDADLRRFIDIEARLRGQDDVLMELIQAYRQDFWKPEVIRPLQDPLFLGVINVSFVGRNEPESVPDHLVALDQVEILIENYDRLEGFRLELASKRLTFHDWEAQVDMSDWDDYALLVDNDVMERLSL
jgi:hypothetical protein